MSDSVFDTLYIHRRVDRWQAGDMEAMDELFRQCMSRMENLARKMTGRYPQVQRLYEASDVLQDALWRLIQSLRSMRPASSRDFFNLAAVHIRRELIDLSRRIQARPELSRRHEPSGDDDRPVDATGSNDSSFEELELWCRLHQAVESLPVEQREAFGLCFYHGWPQEEIAQLFDVDVRTVRRRWRAACDALQSVLGKEAIDTLSQ